MNSGLFIRVLFCIAIVGVFLYVHILKQNTITELRLQIPQAAKELEAIKQENVRLRFEMDQFESPQHLMELSSQPQFSHLKYPLLNEIITLEVP